MSNSLTYTVASSCVYTSPLAVLTIVGLHDFVKTSISALLKSFLLIMCIDAPESTTIFLPSGFRVDAGRHLFSEGEKNVALWCSFNFNTLLASFHAASRAPLHEEVQRQVPPSGRHHVHKVVRRSGRAVRKGLHARGGVADQAGRRSARDSGRRRVSEGSWHAQLRNSSPPWRKEPRTRSSTHSPHAQEPSVWRTSCRLSPSGIPVHHFVSGRSGCVRQHLPGSSLPGRGGTCHMEKS